MLGRPILGVFLCVIAGAWGASALDPGQLDFQEITLDNGLRVISLEDFSCPIVAVNLWYHVGSKDENPERQGFAHMFEHMMFRGTDRLGPTGHFDLLRQVGGVCNGYTSCDETVYVQSVPANQLELVLWLEAERMSFLKIDQDAFDTERKVVEEERRLMLSQPYGAAEEALMAEVFKVHPYRWTTIGKIPHLRASTVPELRAFWSRYYTPSNATLVLAGAVKHEEAEALAKRYFGWIPRCPDPGRVDIHEPPQEQARDVTLELDNAPAPLVGVGYRTAAMANDDLVPLKILSIILGDGASSRAHRRLLRGRALGHFVLKKELAVGVQCMDFTMEQDGAFGLGAALPLSGGQPDRVLAVMKHEIDTLRKTEVKPRELEKARNQLMRKLVTENLRVWDKAAALGRAAVLEGDADRVNRRLAKIQNATADDVLRVARTYLDPRHALTVRIKGNLLGALAAKKNPEDDAPITGQRETCPPPPGRPGAVRPADYPANPPRNALLSLDPAEPFETQTLANGLKVVVVENHEVPFVSVELHLRAGAWAEHKPGCAAMAMAMIGQRTRKQSQVKLEEELDRYAIQLAGWANMDGACVQASCVTGQIGRAMKRMGEAVLLPSFKTRDFDRLKKQTLTQLAVASAEPAYLASRETRRQLYGEHPYARSVAGEPEDVMALKAADLRQWWSTAARPDMAVLYFAGDIVLDRAVQLAEAAFGAWKAKGPKPGMKLPPIPEPAPTHIYLVDKAGNQAQIRIAQRGFTRQFPGYFTSRVVSGYFGGAFGSRINESLRVKKGLTYGARGGYSSQRMAGEFQISTFTKIESVPEAVQTALDEITRLQAEPPAAEEIEDTKNYIVGSFAGLRETPQAIVEDLWMIEAEGLPGDYIKQQIAAVQAATPAACVQLAQSTLDTGRLIIVVVGPADALKEELEKIAPVTIVPVKSASADK